MRRRAAVAALVGTLGAAVGIAGVGHAYLREWGRAAAWFSLVVGVGLVLVSAFTDPEAVSAGTVPPAVVLPLGALLGLSVIDAYRIGRRGVERDQPRPGADGTDEHVPCPSCGRPLDPAIDFCWYCATPLSEAARDEEE